MRPWMRRGFTLLAGVLAVLAAAYYWLIVESHVPIDAAYALDIEELRRLARSSPGELPITVEVERVAAFKFPAGAVVAGDGWQARDLPVFAYRAVYRDRCAVIDTALDRQIGGSELAAFDDLAHARVQAALTQCSPIVITHEHMDHIGGLAAHPDLPAVLAATRLTREQLGDPKRSLPARLPGQALRGYQPLDYQATHLIAPGVVLVKAPGHTPGSQMVYIQTAGGAELLFLGDVAWHFRNIELLRQRARLVSWLFLKEDRTAVFGQLAALKRLHGTAPDVHIVPGHDGAVVDALVAAGVLRPQFALSMTAPSAASSSAAQLAR